MQSKGRRAVFTILYRSDAMKGRLLRVVPLGAAVVLLGAALLTVGCGSSSSRFRFVQAATAVPGNVDLQVDGKSVQTGIGFGQTATYRSISGGSHKFEVFAAGTTSNPYINASVSLSKDTTIFASGQFSNNAIPALTPFSDDNTVPTTGNARVRIIHMAPSAGSVDVYIVQPGESLAGLGPQISPLTNGNASLYQVLPANSYDVVITVTGTQIELVRDGYTFTSEQIRTIVMLDFPTGGGPFSQMVLNDLN
jgi:hypothetical protein